MKLLIVYLSTAVVFFGADLIGLRYLIRPVFERHVGHLLADPFRVLPALLFYMGYIAGVMWFVSLPALRSGDATAALINGALLGLMAYGTYEFTNYATLRDWSMQQVAIDTAWGTVLTGCAAWVGVVIGRNFV